MGKSKGLIIAVVLLILVILGAFYYYKYMGFHNGEMSSAEEDVLVVSETYKDTFYVIGSTIEFDEHIDVKSTDIDSFLTREKENNKKEFLIVNDLNGEVDLSDEQWTQVVNQVKTDENLNCMYLGNRAFEQLYRVGYCSEPVSESEGYLSLGLVHEDKDITSVFGTFTEEDDPEQVGEFLTMEEAYCLRK